MVYNKTIILFIIALLFFSSCNKNHKSIGTSDISIDIEKKDEVSIFDIFSKVEIIRLETTDSSVIKSICKLLIYNDNFFVFDYFTAQILCFNKEGKFIYCINNLGKGPEQYLKLSDFDIYNGRLSLVSTMDGTLHLYDLHGHFVEKYRLPIIKGAYESIKYLNNDTIAFWTFDYKNRLKFYSNVGKKIFKETMPVPNNVYSQFSTPIFPYSNFIVTAFDNRVMQMSPDGKLTLAYQWDFGTLNNDIHNLKKAPDSNTDKIYDFVKKIYSSEVVNYFFGMAGGNSEYLYAQLTRKNRQISIFYNKKTSKKYVFEKTTEGAHIYPLFWTENYVVGFLPSGVKLSIDDLVPNSILNKKNIAIKKQIQEFDNPVLVKYYFKK